MGLVREDRKLEMRVILTWQLPKREKPEGEDIEIFTPGGSSCVKKRFLATFRETLYTLTLQTLSILYFLIGSYLQSVNTCSSDKTNAAKCDMWPWFFLSSAHLRPSWIGWICVVCHRGHALKSLKYKKTCKINTSLQMPEQESKTHPSMQHY